MKEGNQKQVCKLTKGVAFEIICSLATQLCFCHYRKFKLIPQSALVAIEAAEQSSATQLDGSPQTLSK